MNYQFCIRVGSPHVLRDHIAEAIVGYGQGSNIRHTLEALLEQVEAQLPKPAVEEPTEFGSIVRAPWSSKKLLWFKAADNSWWSESGVATAWSQLRNPEVLRVGVGEPPDVTAFSRGWDEAVSLLRKYVIQYASSAHTGQHKDAYKAAIDRLTEMVGEAPESADTAAFDDGFYEGKREMNAQILSCLRVMLRAAITAERKDALEKAIQAVEELAP